MYPGVHASASPEHPAVIVAETGDTLTYRELEDGSVRLAHAFVEHGLSRGDVVALLSDNVPRAFEVYWAARRSGLYITAVNSYLTPDEVAYILNDSGARALVVSAGLAELATAVAGVTPGVTLRMAFGGVVEGCSDYDVAVGGQSTEPFPDQPSGADMLYSSGTTGRPKGVRPPLPDRQIDQPGDAFVELLGPLYGFDRDTVYLSPAPIYHAAPLRFCGVVHALGGTVVLMRRFDAENALGALVQYGATHSQWVPTMFVRMLKLPSQVRSRYDVSTMRVAVHAAAPCPVEVKRAMIEWWGPVLYEYYSSTEGVGLTAITPREWSQRPGSVGRAELGVLHVCGDDGQELPANEVGTVYFGRPDSAFSYHADPEKTRSAQHPDHATWMTTGDIGYVDDDGYLYLTGRKDFTIISGGVNIYPQEVEDVLVLHPEVLDIAVVGVPDAEMGESVLAVVAPASTAEPGADLADTLIAHARAHLARHKVPRRVVFTNDLPRTPTGKILKAEIRRRYATVPAGSAGKPPQPVPPLSDSRIDR